MMIIIINYNVLEIFQKIILELIYFVIDVFKVCFVIFGYYFILSWYSEFDVFGI